MKILFVYNADSDPLSVLMDFGHKILSPSTYECRLCALTYGYFQMNSDWKSFTKSLPYSVDFLHKDEALKKLPELSGHQFPAAYLMNKDEKIQTLISASEMNQLSTLDELKSLLNAKLA